MLGSSDCCHEIVCQSQHALWSNQSTFFFCIRLFIFHNCCILLCMDAIYALVVSQAWFVNYFLGRFWALQEMWCISILHRYYGYAWGGFVLTWLTDFMYSNIQPKNTPLFAFVRCVLLLFGNVRLVKWSYVRTLNGKFLCQQTILLPLLIGVLCFERIWQNQEMIFTQNAPFGWNSLPLILNANLF